MDYKEIKLIFKKYGIRIYISSDDNKHNLPHIHIVYGEERISLNLIDLSVLAGKLKHRKLRIAKKILSDEKIRNFLISLYYKRNEK